MKETSFTKQYIKNGLGAFGAFIMGSLIFAAAALVIVFVLFALNGFSWGSEY